ncbi:MAG: O-methyltransferase [Phycisphaerae bacterium]
MEPARWSAVDEYYSNLLSPADPALRAALEASAAAGLPPIQVSPNQGKLLMLLALARGARTVLEIGTLGGYSTIWLARGLSAGGRVVTLECVARHAEVARTNIVRAGLANVVEIVLGRALDTLPRLHAEARGPFDLVFVDANKEHMPDYFQWALRLTARGSLIVLDNVVRGGEVLDGDGSDPNVLGVRRCMEMIAAEPRVSATVVQTVGVKGYDGFALALVVADE